MSEKLFLEKNSNNLQRLSLTFIYCHSITWFNCEWTFCIIYWKNNPGNKNTIANKWTCYYLSFMTLSTSCVTISLVPLHKPANKLRLCKSIIGVPIFKEIIWDGTQLNSIWLINSTRYKIYALSPSLDALQTL